MSKRVRESLGRRFRAGIFARLVPYFRPYRLPMGVVIAILFGQAGLSLLDPWPMQVLIDHALGSKPLPAWMLRTFPFLATGGRGLILAFAVLAGIGIRLTKSMLDVLGQYLKTRINDGVTLDFKADLFNHLQRLSLSYHDRMPVGESIYRLTNDTGFVTTLVWGNFRHLLRSGLTLIGMVWIVMWIDWPLALLALSIAPILYAGVAYYGRHFKAKTKNIKRLESAAQGVMQEVLSCLRVVKAFGQEGREQRRFMEQAREARWARLRLSLEQGLFSTGLGAVTQLNYSLILLVGGYHVLNGSLSVGQLIVILTYVTQIHGPLEDIGQTLTDMILSMASAERALEVLDIEPEIRDRPGARTLDHAAGAVAFEHVSFAYRPDQPVLSEIEFSARPGEVVAIVGPTGAGKTTLANLIARFYDPVHGRVTLDGHDLRDLTGQTLRASIALVIQEPILLTGTIRENIAYGRPDAEMDKVLAAACDANAHDFITALPDGYDSQVGERGVRLSGGERQRIAIARAFLKDAPILILDEPTSSIDSRTELVIIDALDRLMAGRTTFIIAHRLSTIRRADQILVLDHGRIIERGTHAELLRQDNLYAQLYRIQSSGLRRDKEEARA